MNYLKLLKQAGVNDPQLQQQCLDCLAKCEKDYSRHRIAWHKATAWAVVGWLLLQALRLTKAYFEQVFIAADQLVNALIPPLDGTISYADETLSARSYRAYRDGKIFGKLTMNPINLLFFWQGPGHCKNAYIKEFERKNYPEEYRQGVPIFESRRSDR